MRKLPVSRLKREQEVIVKIFRIKKYVYSFRLSNMIFQNKYIIFPQIIIIQYNNYLIYYFLLKIPNIIIFNILCGKRELRLLRLG